MEEIPAGDLRQRGFRHAELELPDILLPEIPQPLNEVPQPLIPEGEHLHGFPPDELDPPAVLQVEMLGGPVGNVRQGIRLQACQACEVGSLRPTGRDPHVPTCGQGFRYRLERRQDDLHGILLQPGVTEDTPGKPDNEGPLLDHPAQGRAKHEGVNVQRIEILCEEDRPPGHGGCDVG